MEATPGRVAFSTDLVAHVFRWKPDLAQQEKCELIARWTTIGISLLIAAASSGFTAVAAGKGGNGGGAAGGIAPVAEAGITGVAQTPKTGAGGDRNSRLPAMLISNIAALATNLNTQVGAVFYRQQTY